MNTFQMKRVYEPATQSDGFRVLVDRLWPRGMKKEIAKIDLWAKDITPTTQLRKDYHQGRIPWEEFAKEYRSQLYSNIAVDDFLAEIQDKKVVTLVFAGKNLEQCHVTVLLEVLKEKSNNSPTNI